MTGHPKRVKKVIQIDGIKFNVEAFHPRKFERQVYAVSFHEQGKPLTDRYKELIQVAAGNGTQAIGIAIKKFKSIIKWWRDR